MGRLVVVGGLNMDIHLFGLRESGGQAPLVAEGHLAQPGGKAGNVARAAARLGAEVTLVARVGDDDFGQHCLEASAGDGIDVSGVTTTADEHTGFVAIELERGKHRSLVFSPGANELLTWADVAPHVAGLTVADVVVAQAEVPPETLSALAAATAARGVPLYLDPTPPDRVRRDHLLAADVITPDLDEAAQLTGRIHSSRLWTRSAAAELRAAGARRVLLKASEDGALLLDDDGLREVPTARVEAVDETGAGDVFMAALAVRRLEGGDWDEAARFANAASSLSVSRVGLALPDRDEVAALARELAAAVRPPG
ncbi:ribokinase [Nocardioides sp. GY 10113]|uniref:carbohydrate kinase family protein n=1 Tax=Nocardioides sp. GY 10113 TaxID=2569761 RepID=UPI0010A8BCF9|nr:PfkB family carbohydrate kinase [Nocardioides sp. GY 10113]TIC88884.1 ribokinase [Nocardioides sp. GY 10113]